MDPADELAALAPALLGALEALALAARLFNPSDMAPALAATDGRAARLAPLLARLSDWPEALAEVREPLVAAGAAMLEGLAGLAAAADAGDLAEAWRAFRQGPRAQEALWPLARRLPPVSRFFLHPSAREDPSLQARLAAAPADADVGLLHEGGEPGARGAWSAYVPEDWRSDRDWPLVVALHGGAGDGRSFLWSWLREARTFGWVLIAPTSTGRTWALSGPDPDTPRLAAIVEAAHGRWRIDRTRVLLAGMSDGGTFAYVTGLETASPFTHLAPACAAFHPMLAAMADPARLRGLPIHIAHGTADWMFPVAMAREAAAALDAAGAAVTYREVDGLGHAWPREINPEILAWTG